MPNTQQNNIQNEIEQINKEINLLQARFKKNKKQKSKTKEFQNGLMHIRRIRVKQGQRTDLSRTKETQNIVHDIL